MATMVKKEYQLRHGPRLIVLKGSMPDWPEMQLKRTDKPSVIAVVNAANQRLFPGGGVDGMIHAKAGPQLVEECQAKPEMRPGIRCPTGEAVETMGYNLKIDYVIHTCGPVYAVERQEECTRALFNAYRNSMLRAQELGVKCIAFPAISTGVYAYPFRDAAQVSLDALKDAHPPLEELWVVLWAQADFDTFTGLAEGMGLPPYKPRPPAFVVPQPGEPPLRITKQSSMLSADISKLLAS